MASLTGGCATQQAADAGPGATRRANTPIHDGGTVARRRTLRIPTDGVCAGHPCDGCADCEAGRCCGTDVGEAGLPLEGSWPHQWFGDVGRLIERDGRLRCHCCGGWFVDLGRHVVAHNLSGDAYRAMWGLRARRPLAGEGLRQSRAESAVPTGTASPMSTGNGQRPSNGRSGPTSGSRAPRCAWRGVNALEIPPAGGYPPPTAGSSLGEHLCAEPTSTRRR